MGFLEPAEAKVIQTSSKRDANARFTEAWEGKRTKSERQKEKKRKRNTKQTNQKHQRKNSRSTEDTDSPPNSEGRTRRLKHPVITNGTQVCTERGWRKQTDMKWKVKHDPQGCTKLKREQLTNNPNSDILLFAF